MIASFHPLFSLGISSQDSAREKKGDIPPTLERALRREGPRETTKGAPVVNSCFLPGHGQGVCKWTVPLSFLAGILGSVSSYLHWVNALQRKRCSMINEGLFCAIWLQEPRTFGHSFPGLISLPPSSLDPAPGRSMSVCAHPTITSVMGDGKKECYDPVPLSCYFRPTCAFWAADSSQCSEAV